MTTTATTTTTTSTPDQSPSPTVRSGPGVRTEGLGKRFGSLWAVRDLDLDVPAGTVLGLLGHNGAGKTTTIRMLTTLSRPTEGRAMVAGYDTATAAVEVRRRIGVAAQQATVDGLLSARANLEMTGRLLGLHPRGARHQADALLAQLDLADAATSLARTLSGGMRRRLDLAAALMGRPAVLFLDEPTTGLDPRTRTHLWDHLLTLVATGTTIILTTQYLDEADHLADDIVVMDHGRAVAHGTPAQLKARLAGDRIRVTVAAPAEIGPATTALAALVGSLHPDSEPLVLQATLPPGLRLLDVLRALDDGGVDTIDVARHQPTLDDVFLALTTNGADRS